MREKDLSITLAELNTKFKQRVIVAGFDGFIDEIIHIVDKYTDVGVYKRIETIADFADKVNQASGLSANFEYKTIQKKLGGNGPIIANALQAQGNKIHYFGALGLKNIDPIFQEFVEKCETAISVADPGYTEALEFSDGKLMMGKVDCLNLVNWSNIIESYSLNQLSETINNSDLICCTNWTSLYKMNSILEGLGSIELSKRIPLFIDLADPRKRSLEDIKSVISILQTLQNNYNVVLGLNEKESVLIADVLDINVDDTLERSRLLQRSLDIYCVVIHPVKYAVASTEMESFRVEGPFCSNPKLSTGAGDNFNAGFCCGLINNLCLKSSLYLGACSSGYYVRKMHSPELSELKQFISSWIDGNIED